MVQPVEGQHLVLQKPVFMENQVHLGEGWPQRMLVIPAADIEVIPGVPWGPLGGVPTAAYWATLAFEHSPDAAYAFTPSGRDLEHEVAFCILGGYGIPAELGWVAYRRLDDRGLVYAGVGADEIRAALAEPLEVNGAMRRYRFVNVKAKQLAGALRGIASLERDAPDRELRDALLTLPGVGLKTASWVIRNMRGSDDVAIIDIHLARACRRLGVFRVGAEPSKHYREMELRFLAFARALGVRASYLDLLMWEYARAHPILTAA